MAQARTITLFAPPSRPYQGSSSWVVSLVVHAAIFGWLFYGLAHVPHVQNRTLHQRFVVRVLNAPMTKPEVRQYAATGSPVHPAAPVTPLPPHAASAAAPSAPAPELPAKAAAATPAPAPAVAPAHENPAPATPAAIQLAQTTHQQQTLIQPDAPKELLLQHPTPVPLVMMWAHDAPVKPAIAAPPPKPTIANLHSSIARPNREAAPAPINISSTPFHSVMPTIAPGTTSPVVMHGPDTAKQMPTVAAESDTPPAPVRIISLSDRQQAEGPVAVPLANASARPSTSQSLTAGKADNAGGTGRGNAGSQTAGNQPAQETTKQAATGGTGPARVAGNTAAKGAGTGGAGTTGSGPGSGTTSVANSTPGPAGGGPGIGSENPAAVKRITMPKDGQFGVVVVGSSLADEYPETAAIWAGRLVYTVYLRVGMGKSWILQYSLPAGTQAAASGARPDAPWPYDLVVPRLDAGEFNSDALMVHGFVNASGKFEKLNVVLPPEFAQSKFVLNALEQWQFRAARQNGQTVPVEILLIIPAQDE